MNKLIYLLVVFTVILSSCGSNQDSNTAAPLIAKGNVKYGGVFKMNETEDFKSLYPLNITMALEDRIASQIYEGLVQFNQEDLSIIPSLAESWEVNENATSYTFHLRKGVKFHDNKCFEGGVGREVKAADFKYCFDRICESSPTNQMYWTFKDKVKGANEHFNSLKDKQANDNGVTGITVIDDYTLKIELNHPFAGFLNILAHNATYVYPKEAVTTYGAEMRINPVGSGAFAYKRIKLEKDLLISFP